MFTAVTPLAHEFNAARSEATPFKAAP